MMWQLAGPWWINPETGQRMVALAGGDGNGSQPPPPVPAPAPAPAPTEPPKDFVQLPPGVRAANGGVLTTDDRVFINPNTGKRLRRMEDGSIKDFDILTPDDRKAVLSQIGLGPEPPSAEEAGFRDSLNRLVDLATADFQRQSELLAQLMPSFRSFFEAQARLSTLAALSAERLLPLQESIFRQVADSLVETPATRELRELGEKRALAFLRGEALPVSEGRARLIEQEFGEARRRGEGDIRRFGEELAGARGLRLTDTPIGQEVLRAQTDLAERLRAGEAGARLTEGSVEEQRMLALHQFQENLRNQAQLNRFGLLLGQNLGGNVPPLPTVSAQGILAPAIGGLTGLGQSELGRAQLFQQGQLGRARIGADIDIANIQADVARAAAKAEGRGRNLAGIGAILSGIGAIRAAFSSVHFKRDIEPLDPYEESLDKLRETPLFRWRYKWERDEDRTPHIGPILELSPPEIREDAWRINLGDYSGLQHAAIKALDRKVEALQRRLAKRVA